MPPDVNGRRRHKKNRSDCVLTELLTCRHIQQSMDSLIDSNYAIIKESMNRQGIGEERRGERSDGG